MKKLILTVVAGIVSVATFAQGWSLDKAHANVSFSITHMMLSEVDGNFKKFDAKVTSAKSDFSDAKFEFSADVASISTGNEMRDGHLQGKDYFDAAGHGQIKFVSTGIKSNGGNKYTITGNMTMKGVTKPLTLAAVINGPVENPRSKKQMIGVKATGTLDRTAFGVSTAGPSLGSEVEFKVAGEFTKD
jgi:polyisoprenoid-binding protein YceI